MTRDEWETFNKWNRDMYQTFVNKVAAGRGQEVVDEGPGSIGHTMGHGDAVLGRGPRVGGRVHDLISSSALASRGPEAG